MERKYYLRGLGIGIAVTAIIMGIALSGDRKMTDAEIIARAKELGMVENTVLSEEEDQDASGVDAVDPEAAGDTESAGKQDTAAGQDITEGQDITAGQDITEDQEAAEDAEKAEKPDAAADQETAAQQDTAGEDSADTASADDASDELTADGPAQETPQDEALPEEEDGAQEDVPGQSAEQQSQEDGADAGAVSSEQKTITINSGDGSYTVAKKLQDAGVVISAETFDDYLCEHGYDKKLRTGTFSIPADAGDEQIARIVTGRE